MKIRKRILLLSSLLLLVSVGGIGNLMWQMPRIDQAPDLKAVLHGLILLGLFGAGLIFSVLELVRQEIMSPIFQLASQIVRLKERKIDGHRLELVGSKDIDLLTRALNNLLDSFQKEEDFYRIITESSPDMIYLLDRDGRVLFGNHNAARQWNYRPDEIIGKRQEELFPPDIAEHHKRVIAKIFETGQPISFDEHKANGPRKCWLDTHIMPVLDEGGHVTAVIGISHDITARKQAEAALGENQRQFKDLVETLRDWVWEVDPQGHYVYVSPRVKDILGYKPEEIIGKPRFDLMPAEEARRIGEIFKSLAANQQAIVALENVILHKDGHRVVLETSGLPFFDAERKFKGYRGVDRDISERKRAEERLKKVNECLLSFGADFKTNITRITALCGELLGGTCSLYNRLEGGRLNAIGQWHTPPDFNPQENAEGHICYDVIHGVSGENIVFVPDLLNTRYAETDPNVRRYGLRSYFGHKVHCGSESVGSLCVVFQQTFTPTENDKHLLSILASALSVEESRHLAEQALKESEARYRTLFTGAAEGILIADSQTKQLLFANPALGRMLGYSEAELLKMNVADILPKASLEKVKSEFEAQLKGEKVLVRMLPFLRKDKTIVYADVNASPLVIDGRKSLVGFFTDVSGQLAAESRSAMLARAIETAHHGCLIIAEDARVLFINDYGLAKLGLVLEKGNGKRLADFCADKELIKNAMETMRITKRWIGETVFNGQDGSQFPVLVSISKLDERNALGGADSILLFQDITVQKEMREKLLASERLAVMGRLVADVAHELNNPLAIIIGGTQLILKQLDEKKPELQNQLERILRNGKRCKTILANLLGYGRTVAKKSELINLQELVHEAIDGVSFQYDMSGIETVLNCDKLCNLNVAGNRAALLSVFINVVRNARQAMGSKGKLTINLGKQDDDSIRIEISDSGIGLSKEQMENLFKPFFSGWQEDEGSGLGLPTSLGIIETHGGKMTAFSNGSGQGSTFVVTLPYSVKEDEPSQ